MNLTAWLRIPAAGLLAILTACAASPETRPPAPTRPLIVVIEQPDGGLCLVRDEAEKLGRYILELERISK